jgi:flagellar hook-basal body complex protein FliE
MAKKAVTAQERLEQLIGGVKANADGPKLDVAGLQGFVDELNTLEANVNQAKQAQKAATKKRDDRLKEVLLEVQKAELAVKSHYGPRSPKNKEYILSAPKAVKKATGK